MRSVRRWGLLILVGSLVSGATALAVSRVIPPEYVATAELYIAPASNPTVAFQDVVLGTNVARSYVQLIAAEVVLRPAMEKTGWTDLRNFSDRVNAAQVPNTSIITVSFRDQDPNRAADVANAIAQSFIAQTQALQTSLQGTTVAQLETQINSVGSDISLLDQQISALRAEIAATPRPGQSASSKTDLQLQMTQLDAARQSKQQTLAQLLKTRDDMNLSSVRAQSTVSMWQPATAPDQPVSPRVALNTGLGLVSGALLTLLAVLVIGYFDDRLSDFDDV